MKRIAARGQVILDKTREDPRPGPALRRYRGAINLEKASVNAAIPLRHGPMREALIEIGGQESNERRMDPFVRIEAVHDTQPVAMPNRSGGPLHGGRVGSARRFEASAPESADGY